MTFLYTDVEGSTQLLDQLGERYADLLAEERRLIRAIVRAHDGVEIDSRADEFFAAFPEAADPGGAALVIQRSLRDHAWPDGVAVRVRTGLHHGIPQMTDEGYVGLDVHRAARVGSAAHGGQILLSDASRKTRSLGSCSNRISMRPCFVSRIAMAPNADASVGPSGRGVPATGATASAEAAGNVSAVVAAA